PDGLLHALILDPTLFQMFHQLFPCPPFTVIIIEFVCHGCSKIPLLANILHINLQNLYDQTLLAKGNSPLRSILWTNNLIHLVIEHSLSSHFNEAPLQKWSKQCKSF